MSSLKRAQSSKANGALSKGPTTQAGKQRSSLNALRHGLCAKCIVLDHESRENFLILLQQHVDRFQPADEVEFNMIEEMCAAYWRQRRAWAIETALLDKQIALQSDGSDADRMASAFDTLAAAPTLPLLQRYETRLHLMYQRALRTLTVLQKAALPNEPNPVRHASRPVVLPQPPVAPAEQASEPVVPPAEQASRPVASSQPTVAPPVAETTEITPAAVPAPSPASHIPIVNPASLRHPFLAQLHSKNVHSQSPTPPPATDSPTLTPTAPPVHPLLT